MKIKYFLFAFLMLVFACQKQNVSDDDDFAEEEIEYIDNAIDEREADDTPKYNSEAENKIDAITAIGGTVSDIIAPENDCQGFRYGSYFVPRQEIKVSFIYAGDNLSKITCSDGVIKNLRKDTRNAKAWYFMVDSMTKNLEMIYFTFHLNSNSPVKGVRFLENHPVKGFYGTSQWGRMTEREALNLPVAPSSLPSPITSSYIPTLGDVLYFGDREGVITTVLPKNKQGKFKFKVTEWNAKCTGRKMTSSRLLFDVTKIVSGNKIDTATRFAR